MTAAPSIKEALELLPCPFCGGEAAFNKVTYSERTLKEQEWDQDTFHGVNCVRCGVSNIGIVGHKDQERAAAFWNTRATLQPSGERREAIARAMFEVDALPHFTWDEVGQDRHERYYCMADAAIASGLVQDEAGIRADEREKCAKIALSNRRQEEWYRHADVKRVAPTRLIQLVIHNAIRSARNGGEE